MKKFKLPSSYTIVFVALLVTTILTYFIPVSIFDKSTGEVVLKAVFNKNGEIEMLAGSGLQPAGIWTFIQAPILGFQKASDVAIALLIAGGFLNVLAYTGALDAGIGKLLTKFKGNVLIAVLTFVFAVLGTVFGLWEEIPAFAVAIIPLFILAGYDVMVGLGVLFIGATIGNMASIVNPFSVGAAVSAIGNKDLSLGSGIILRMVIFLVLYIIGTFYLIQYANRVKKDKSTSAVANLTDIKTLTGEKHELPELDRKRFWSAMILVGIVFFMIIGYVPWEEFGLSEIVNYPLTALAKVPFLGTVLETGKITPFGDWYFDEFSFLFFVGALLLKIINKINEKEFFRVFIEGSKDLLGVVMVLGISRGISIIMGSRTSGMSVTMVYWISKSLASAPLWAFAIVVVLAYIVIGIFLQSTSGVASISMPILGAVAAALFGATMMGEIGGQILLISAFTTGINFISGLYPGATTMGTLELVNVPYDYYLKYMLKILVPMIITSTIIISIAPYIGLV